MHARLRWRPFHRIGALAALLSTACGLPEPAALESSIVDGTRETGEPAVVALMGVSGVCTGTLISPQVVLTAKHCVVPERAEGPIPPSLLAIGIGDRVFGATRTLRVREIVTTPGPLRLSGGFDPVGSATGTDVALLILRERIDDITPIPVRRTSAADLTGSAAVAIGFGNTRAGGSGLKNRQDTTISQVTPFLLEAIETICQGDSGGPLLVEQGGVREVAGIASFGVYAMASEVGMCPSDADYWNRVDAQLPLIDLALLRGGDCPPSETPREEACNSLDDDCDGDTDEDCLGLGELCASDDECAWGSFPEGGRATTDPEPVRCLEVAPGESRCTIACDATSVAGCTAIARPLGAPAAPIEGMYCRSTAGCTGLCMPGAPGAGPNGAGCAADTDCASLRCVELGGARVCVTPCVADAGACPLGEICSALTGTTGADACGFCAGASSLPTGRALGEVCDDASQCASGVCQPVDGTGVAAVCTRACDNDGGCPVSAFRCEDGVCAPGPRSELLDPCRDGSDCIRTATCVGDPGRTYCTIACTMDAECGAASRCDLAATPAVCVPLVGPTGALCAADDDCTSGVCLAGLCALPCDPREGCAPGLACIRRPEGAFCEAPGIPIEPPMASGCGCRASGDASWRGALAILLAACALHAHRRGQRRWRYL